jgi:pimeloyl-ACP methyl ester carboxylesterase
MGSKESDLTVVLVHGSFHGKWCWERITPLLDAAEVSWRAMELPLTSLSDDARSVSAVLDEVGEHALLVGHSYGGAVITEAGVHPAVERLVYLAGIAPDRGESCAAAYAAAEGASSTALGDDGFLTALPASSSFMYNQCSPADTEAAVARFRPTHMACFIDEPSEVAWRDRPCSYVVCTNDQGIDPNLQRTLAERMDADTLVWDLDHCLFYSDPQRLAALLVDLSCSSHAAPNGTDAPGGSVERAGSNSSDSPRTVRS